MCPDFVPGCCVGGYHNALILTRICTAWLLRTWSMGVEMFRSLLKAATYHRYLVPNMCRNPSTCASSFLQAYNVTPFKWLKLFNGGTWLYPRVNVANTVHISKHHSYCLQSHNRRHKDRPPEYHLIVDNRVK